VTYIGGSSESTNFVAPGILLEFVHISMAAKKGFSLLDDESDGERESDQPQQLEFNEKYEFYRIF
jgi:hypothetical protein